MDKSALDKVCQKIYKQFPPVVNKRPKVLNKAKNGIYWYFQVQTKHQTENQFN